MGLFDIFRQPKTELQKATDELGERLFPGGRQEILFKATAIMELSNGKLNIEEASRVCWAVKTRVFFASTKFDGRKNLGPNPERLMQQVQEDTKGKLATNEAAAIVFYLIFNKVDPGLETPLTLRKYLEVIFGSDSYGCDADEIPSGLGEFGFDPTNPIPVRGTASNDIYLGGLRTKNGQVVVFKRLGSLTSPNIDGNIDEYEISQGGRVLCKLYISPYNKRTSERPPAGFILVRED
jgi:hypothetical protein